MKILFNSLYYLLIAGITGVGLLLVISLVPQSGIKIKVVKSGSMEPAIRTGSIVVDTPEASYAVGDIVTFGADTKTQIPTTHRIVAITPSTGSGQGVLITTKGDANDAPDPVQTPVSAVHGKVLFSVPYLGYVLSYARQPLGFALLVGLPALAIIFEEILKIIREVRRLRRRKFIHAAATYQQPQRRKIIVD